MGGMKASCEIVVDLEKLAVQRDRGYLVRLVLMLGVGVLVSIFLWRGLTGEAMSGCMADAMLGAEGTAK